MTVGESIKKARQNKNYSRARLAIKSNISECTIRCWEGDTSSPSVDLLIRVADVLDISLDKLVGRERY